MRRRTWWTLGMLTLVSMIDWADRALIGVVGEFIKLEFELSNTQLGLLMGFAFVGFRALIGVPVGRLADVHNRRNVLAAALTIWSSMTLLMGVARNYVEIVIARIGVGAGTAGSYPPTLSMIADLFPLEKRGLAMGVWNLGGTIGFALGTGIGGAVTFAFGWRAAMIYFGAVGLAVAVLLLVTVREPTRRDSRGKELATEKAPGFGELLEFVRRQRSLVHVTIGFSLLTIVDIAIGYWTVIYFVRSHGLDVLEAGGILATVWLVAGIPATLLGGFLMDRLARRDIRWHAWMIVCICLVSVIPAPFIYMSPTVPMAMTAVFVSTLVWNMWFAPQTTILTGLVGSRARAIAWATFSAILLIVGQGFGPLLIGAVTDLLEPSFGIHALRYAMLISILCMIWAALHFYLASRTLGQDYDRASSV